MCLWRAFVHCLKRPEEGAGPHGTGVTGSCRCQESGFILWKSSQCVLTAELLHASPIIVLQCSFVCVCILHSTAFDHKQTCLCDLLIATILKMLDLELSKS